MKRINRFIVCAAASLMLLAACTEENAYRVKGEGSALKNGDTLFLTTDLVNLTPTDTIIVKDGQFTLSGQTDSTFFCLIYSASDDELAVPFFIEPGTITIDMPKDMELSRVSGTPCNNEWQVVNDTMMSMSIKMNRLASQMYSYQNEEQMRKTQQQMDQLNAQFKSFIHEKAKKNISNEFGYFLVTFYCNELLSPTECRELIAQMPEQMRQRSKVKELEEDIKMTEGNNEGQIGNFKMADMSGQEISILEEVKKHKLTVLDFWASWCGPCRRAVPQVVQIYSKYHEKGLGIIGISLDEDKNSWTKAINDMGMTWTHVSDLKGWDNAIAKSFGIRAIPHMMLVDQQGSIINFDVEEPEALEKILAEKLN